MLVAAFLGAGLLAGCGESAGPEVSSKEINLYIWAEYTPPNLIRDFEQKYDLKANVSFYENNADMIEGVESNPGKYDLIIPSDFAVEIMRRKELLEPLGKDFEQEIPNFDNVEQRFRAPNFDPGNIDVGTPGRRGQDKFTIPYAWGTTGLVYNTKKVSKPVTRWEDLFRAEFRKPGAIVTVDDERVPTGATLLTLGKDFNSADPADLAAAERKLETISRSWTLNNEIPEDELVKGSAVIGLMYNGNGELAQQKDPDLRYVLPEEGPNIFIDNMAIPKDAPHADAAKAFMNFMMEPQNAAQITSRYGYSSVNQKAIELLRKTDPKLVQSSVVTPSLSDLNDAKISKDLGNAGNARFVEVWKQVTAQ